MSRSDDKRKLFFLQQKVAIKEIFHALWGAHVERRYDKNVKSQWSELQRELEKYFQEAEKLLANGEKLH